MYKFLMKKLIEQEIKPSKLASLLNITGVSLKEKMLSKRDFKLREIREMKRILKLSNEEIIDIIFNLND